jgi:hypothetical protein
MPVAMCANPKCGLLISISDIPGGNPAVQMQPDLWAKAYGRCESCGAIFCDRCISERGGSCPQCGKTIQIVGEASAAAGSFTAAEPAIGAYQMSDPPEPVVPSPEPTPVAWSGPTGAFAAAEWRDMQFAPLWAFVAVAGADRTIDQDEVAALSKELTEALLYKNELARRVFSALAIDFGTIWPAFQADPRDCMTGLMNVAELLDRKVPAEEANGFKKSVLEICVNVAKASGGGTPGSVENVCTEETGAFVLVAAALRVQL